MKARESNRRGILLVPRINKKMDEFLSIFRPITQRPSWRYTCNHLRQCRSISSFNNCQEEFNQQGSIPRPHQQTDQATNELGKENKLLSSKSIDQRLQFTPESCQSKSIMQITFGSGNFVPSKRQQKMSNSVSVSPETHKEKRSASIGLHNLEQNICGSSQKLLLPKISHPLRKYKSSLQSLHNGFQKKGCLIMNRSKLRTRMKDIFA